MKYRLTITEEQQTLASNALRLAADEYAKLAKQLRDSVPTKREFWMNADRVNARLADSFEQQERETRELIELIEEADEA